MTWMQNYDPLGNVWLSALVALIPIIFFFLALTVFKLKGIWAGFITVVIALLVALFLYKMPVSMAVSSAVYGFVYGLWPIAWIIVGAVFLYNLSVKSGSFDIIRASIMSLTADQRIQMLLVGFAFGSFLEGAAGFGAPVAITAALLMGLGFKPLYAAGLCLIANTAPVAFGAVGIPITVAGQVAGIDAMEVSQMATRQLTIMVPIVLVWLMVMMDGWRGLKETLPAVIVCAVVFGAAQYFTANYVGPELPNIISAIASLIALTILCKFWQPKHIFRFEGQEITANGANQKQYTAKQILWAWAPFILLTIMVVIWSLPSFKALFKEGGILAGTIFSVHVPYLDNLVEMMSPVKPDHTPYPAVFKFDVIAATGTSILIACILSVIHLRMKVSEAVSVFADTLKSLRISILSIGLVLAFAFVANYSGLSSTLALALSETKGAFTFFSPFLGWLGVFLTGSDTSANALFAALQGITAQQIHVPEVLLVAANTSGGVTGKMISPQSIAIACAAVGLVGKESALFRFTVKHSLIFAVIMGIIVTLYAYVFPGAIPGKAPEPVAVTAPAQDTPAVTPPKAQQ